MVWERKNEMEMRRKADEMERKNEKSILWAMTFCEGG
jgi:hypothetical protein